MGLFGGGVGADLLNVARSMPTMHGQPGGTGALELDTLHES